MKRAAYCDECKHYRGGTDRQTVCGRGHLPKFYFAKSYLQLVLGDFGWKRRCPEFKDARTPQ